MLALLVLGHNYAGYTSFQITTVCPRRGCEMRSFHACNKTDRGSLICTKTSKYQIELVPLVPSIAFAFPMMMHFFF